MVVDPVRAKKMFKKVLGEFFDHRIWIGLLLIGGFIGMLVGGVDRLLLLVAAPFAIAALVYTLMWLRRLAHWWRCSHGW